MRVRIIARSFFVLELFTLTARFGRLDSIIGSPPANARLYRHAESVPRAILPCASESREDVPMAPRDHVLERGMYAHGQVGGGGARAPKARPCSEGPNATCGKRGPHNAACPDADPKRRAAMNSASKRAEIVAKDAKNRRAAEKRKSAAGANSTADKKTRVVGPPDKKGETTRDRSQRHRVEAGDRFSRFRAARLADEAQRRDPDAKPKDGRPAKAVWPPRAANVCERGVTKLTRLQCYFEHLGGLPSQVDICRNCLQRGHDLAPNDKGICWFCQRADKAHELHYDNGLDLCLAPDDIAIADRAAIKLSEWSHVSAAVRRELNELPSLSPLEEALISRVQAITTVLTLPGGQLGYRGNVINFVNDTATVAKQLPRTVADCGMVFYAVKGKDKSDGSEVTQMKRVRRSAIEKWLTFLSKHHDVYKRGIRNRDAAPGAS